MLTKNERNQKLTLSVLALSSAFGSCPKFARTGVYFFGIGAVGGSGGCSGGEDEFAGSGREVDRLRRSSPTIPPPPPSSRGGPPLVIDATMKGGRARFVNHSCAPNCFAELVSGGGGIGDREKGEAGGAGKGGAATGEENTPMPPASCRPRVLIRAAVDLMPGEEVTYDYCLSGEPEAGGGGGGSGGVAAGRSHDLHHASGGSGGVEGAGGEVVRCCCGAPACRGVL